VSHERILLVDDNASNLKLALFILAPLDYQVRSATNAYEALTLVDEFQPELVLLDLQLPDRDGLSVVRQLKSDPRTAHIPIIAVTANAMKGDEETARAAGVCDYVTKPIDKNILRAAIAAQLNKTGGA
jgi:two-component system, cell cycle response regulator DivK